MHDKIVLTVHGPAGDLLGYQALAKAAEIVQEAREKLGQVKGLRIELDIVRTREAPKLPRQRKARAALPAPSTPPALEAPRTGS